MFTCHFLRFLLFFTAEYFYKQNRASPLYREETLFLFVPEIFRQAYAKNASSSVTSILYRLIMRTVIIKLSTLRTQ